MRWDSWSAPLLVWVLSQLRLFGLGAGGHNRGVDCREAVHSPGHKSGTRPNKRNVVALLLLGGVLGFLLRLASVPSGWGPRQFVCVHVLGGALGFSSASGQRPSRLGPAPVCVLLGGVELCSTSVSIISFTPHSEWVESPMLWHG